MCDKKERDVMDYGARRLDGAKKCMHEEREETADSAAKGGAKSDDDLSMIRYVI